MKCKTCQEPYDADHDVVVAGQRQPDWHAEDGKCYDCFVVGLFELYGEFPFPVFTINGVKHNEAGPLPDYLQDGATLPF